MNEHAQAKVLSPPEPGTAPWAPKIIYTPLPRWPVVIPLSLLAVLASGIWLLMEKGILPAFTRFAGGP